MNYDASAYVEWAEKRLPTKAEWEWAASGGQDMTTNIHIGEYPC